MNFIARLISCFIPVSGVRRRVRKNLRMRAPISRKDAIEIIKKQCGASISREDVNNMIVAREQAVADIAAQKAAQEAAVAAAAREDLHKRYDAVKQEWYRRNNGVALIPGRFVEYDLAFGIGTGCAVVSVLSAHGFRLFSSPLDWTGGAVPEHWQENANVWRDSRFKEKIDSVCEEFANWFHFEDLVLFCKDFSSEMWILNKRTNIRFIHLLNSSQSFEMQFPAAAEKMERRGKRLIDAIKKSDKILICWMHRVGDDLRLFLDAPVSDADVLYGLEKLKKKWPNKQFDIVFFEHDGTKNEFEFEKIELCPGAYRIRSNHFVVDRAYNHVYPYQNNIPPVTVIAEALDNIKLTDRLKKDFTVDQGL